MLPSALNYAGQNPFLRLNFTIEVFNTILFVLPIKTSYHILQQLMT